MSDLFEPLRSLADEPGRPLTASEVRRRGDRRRRRRTALQSLAAACAVAVVATGAAVAFDVTGSQEEAPVGPATSLPEPTADPTDPPTTAPSPTADARIPDTFPLAVGIEELGSDGDLTGPARDVPLLADLMVCEQPGYDVPATATDRLTLVAAMPQYVRGRDLSLYPDAATASAAAADLVGAYRGCPTFSPDGGATTTTNTVRRSALGQESWSVAQTYETAEFGPMLGQEVVHVVRVGAAVLVTVTNSEGPGAMFPDRLAESVAEEARSLEPLVEAMCDLPGSGCA